MNPPSDESRAGTVADPPNASSPGPGRDYSIPGLAVELHPPGGPWALTVRSARRREEWRLHSAKLEDRVAPDYVLTTIAYKGERYRIDAEEQGGAGWIYRMTLWPDNEPAFHIHELSAFAYVEGAAEEVRRRTAERRLAFSFVWDGFVLGWLPGRIQTRLAERMEFTPLWASRRNAVLTGLGCLLFAASLLFQGKRYYLLPFIGVFAGIFRLGQTVTSGEPCGFIVLEIADKFYRRMRRRAKPQP